MRIKLVLDVQDSTHDLIAEFIRKLEHVYAPTTQGYINYLAAFDKMLDKLLTDAFELGLAKGGTR